MEIKEFNLSHMDKVSALLNNCTPYVMAHPPYVYWIVKEYFPSLCYVAQDQDRIVGFICALHSAEKDCVFMWQLAVDDAYRRMGTAMQLCEKIAEYARNNKVGSLQATIDDDNPAVHEFLTAFVKRCGASFTKKVLPGLDGLEGEIVCEINL